MITEDYVSFETAKLLKEKGFNEGCSFVVNAESKGVMSVSWSTTNSDIEDERANLIALPTLQMAMKWLREVHNFNINIELTIHGYFCSLSHIVRDSSGYIIDIEDSEAWETAYCDSYEESCEAAIKYCLENLI